MLLWQKMVMLYLAIAIGCTFYNPSIIFNDQSSNMLQLYAFDNSTWNTTNTIGYSSSTAAAVFNATEQGNNPVSTSITNPFFLIDALFSVIKFIKIIFAVIFSPFVLMAQTDMPYQIRFLFGIPLITALIIGLIGFIRGTG